MKTGGVEKQVRRVALGLLLLGMSAGAGAGIAEWAVADVNGFYMNPIDHYGSPAYARHQPIADSFWERQDPDGTIVGGYQSAVASTATSAQPTYRSASGS